MTKAAFSRHAAAFWRDPWRGLDRSLGGGVAALLRVLLGLALGWWLYVPLHELLHAAGCVAAGGSVTKLEIDAMYGGAILSRVFPFVVAGGDYAGRLAGFDTRGSDLIYLATDLAPYLLTLWPGFWALRGAAARGRAFGFGFWLPWALAPVISLSGDAYEIGSLAVRHLPVWSREPVASQLVGDDVVRKAGDLLALGGEAPWVGFVVAFSVGAVWAWGWIAGASWLAERLGRAPLGGGLQGPERV